MEESRLRSRLLSLLVVLYWLLFAGSLVMAALIYIPETAVYVRLAQLAGGAYLGFLTPFGVFAYLLGDLMANLWWLMLLAAPFVLSLKRRPMIGLAISVAAALALFLVPPRIIDWQSARLVAAERGPALASRPAGPVTSITLPADGCNPLCEQLLLGGEVQTVRVAAPTQEGVPHLMFQRRPAADCQALDPDFPQGGPCLLARPDDGAQSDLKLSWQTDGSPAPTRESLGFTPHLMMKERLTITRPATGETLDVRTRLVWLSPASYVPLHPNTGFDGSGIHGGGLVPDQQKHEDPPLDPAGLLTETGLSLAAPRGEIVVDKRAISLKMPAGYASPAFLTGYPEPAPYDIALIRSLLDHGGLRTDTGTYYVTRWLAKFERHKVIPDQRDRALFDALYAGVNPAPHELSLLRQSHPAYFSGGLDQLYADALSSEGGKMYDAMHGIVSAALRQTPEQNAPQAADYLRLIGIKKLRDSFLIDAAGRFPFDPTPVLHDYLQKSDWAVEDRVHEALKAACRADQRWAGSLTPFILQTVREVRQSDPSGEDWQTYSFALAALNVLRQREAWESLRAELGPEIVTRVSPGGVIRTECP
ncbi:MAG: hypothetical protein JSR87_11290 [Proteobacteria bacterium]|nr:hypothetical protein [Pseudomonadota bacterium]MBS0572584.1 hypothetical protein [Pseudomonadota bacterium]